MRVIVCGGRDFSDTDFIWNMLTSIHQHEGPFTTVIHGCAPGVDSQAEIWAATNNLKIASFRAEWQKYGNYAGSIRNGRMLREGNPDLVIAFPGSRGTRNMIRQAEEADIRVIRIAPD